MEISSLLEASAGVRRGRMRVAGTGITVHRIATWDRMGWSPEEMVRRYPHLPLAGVHAALAHYYANRDQIDGEIAAEDAEADEYERRAVEALG